jgi:hypothetical protein
MTTIIKASSDLPRGGTALGSTPPIVTALPANPQFGEQVTLYNNGAYQSYQFTGDGWRITIQSNRYAQRKRTAGSITLNSSAWANVDTGLDITLGAAAGDVIEYAISANLQSGAEAYFDVVSIVSGSPVNSFSRDAAPANPPTGYGFLGWLCTGSVISRVTGSIFHTLAAGDVSGGNVTLRLRYSVATARVIDGTSGSPLHVWARNLGPVTA